MRLTRDPLNDNFDGPRTSPGAPVYATVVVALASIFWLDRLTASAPLQHLYYIPIILASLRVGRRAGLWAATGAIALYHLANPVLFSSAYREPDIVQIALFIAVALVTATLAEDRRRLRKLAATDDLTGLHNLRSFESRLAGMVHAARAGSRPMAMMVLDIDRLKAINDVHGHLAGAESVRTVGHILAARLPPDAVACRYGGDEFAVALPGYTGEEAYALADDLRRYVARIAPVLGGITFGAGALSISIGVGSLPALRSTADQVLPEEDGAAGEALFTSADRALYLAKHAGRNRVRLAG